MEIVSFIPGSKLAENLVPRPKPAKNYIPTWFKEMPNMHKDQSGFNTTTAKKCVPFVDSMISGYIQELWCDLEILTSKDSLRYKWAGDIRPVSTRIESAGTPNLFPKFNGYCHEEIHWLSQYEPKTPKGWSTLYSHPSARYDLPFVTLSGIIDTDEFNLTGPVPFLIKKGFSGIIPAGTPIYQMTFIKREDWKSNQEEFNENEISKKRYSVRKHFFNGYRNKYWSKKSFE
jgi:hypothetical protein